MIARGLSGAVLWGLFGLLLAVVLLAGSALSKRYAPKVGSGTLLVSAMSVDVEPRLSAAPAPSCRAGDRPEALTPRGRHPTLSG